MQVRGWLWHWKMLQCWAGISKGRASPNEPCAGMCPLLCAPARWKIFASVPHVTYFMHGKQVLSSMAEHRRTLATEVNCIVLQSQHERAAEMHCM